MSVHGGCKAGDGRKEEKMEEGEEEEEEEDLMSTMDHGSLVNFLEKEVLFLSTPSSLVRAVEKLLKSVPQSEHRAIAQNVCTYVHIRTYVTCVCMMVCV